MRDREKNTSHYPYRILFTNQYKKNTDHNWNSEGKVFKRYSIYYEMQRTIRYIVQTFFQYLLVSHHLVDFQYKLCTEVPSATASGVCHFHAWNPKGMIEIRNQWIKKLWIMIEKKSFGTQNVLLIATLLTVILGDDSTVWMWERFTLFSTSSWRHFI